MRHPASWIVFGFMLIGCTPSQIARQASRSATDEAAEQLTRKDTQKDLEQASRDPKMQQAMQNSSEQVAEGILQALESDRARAQISAITRGITQSAVQQLFAALGDEQTRAMMDHLARSVTDNALKQMAANMEGDLGPAMRSMLQRDMAEGIAGALGSDALQPGLATATQTFAHNAALGLNSGFGAAWTGDTGATHEARALPGLGSVLTLGLVLAGLMALALLSVAVIVTMRARQSRYEVERLESATLLLATAMRERQQTEQTDEILAVVQSALEARADKSGKHRIRDAMKLRKAG
jgi:hypothetical protein